MKLKHWLIPAVLLGSLALLSACADGSGNAGSNGAGDGDLKGQQLVFVNYGGEGLEAAKAGWLDPFSKKTGVKFATDGPTDPAKIKAMVESGRTTWDVVDIDVAVGGSNCGTLFEKRPSGFDMSQVKKEFVTDECGVPIITQAVTVVYNKKLYGDNPPTKAEDFMDVKKFPGKRIFFNYPTGTVEPLLMTTGLAPDKIFPVDWSKVEAAVKHLGKEATPQDTVAMQVASLESGDFGMCLCYLGRTAKAVDNGADIGILWDKTYLAWDGLYAIKGSKAPKAQSEFLQYIATPAGQEGFMNYLPYGATTVGKPNVKEEYKAYLPEFNEGKIKQTYKYSVKFWTDTIDQSLSEWTRIMAG